MARPVFNFSQAMYSQGLDQASTFVHTIISSKILPIINKWIGSNDVFMMQLDMIKKTVANVNFYFLIYKGSQVDRYTDGETAFGKFLEIYFDSLFSDKYFGESHFNKIEELTEAYYNDFLYPELYCHQENEDFNWEIAAEKAIEDMNKIVSSEN